MKKLLKFFSFSLILLALFSSFSSARDCIETDLGDYSICVGIDKKSNNRYTVTRSNLVCNGDCMVTCDILLPDNTLTHVGSCNGSFTYNGNSSKKVKLYITINDESTTIVEYYDFGDGSREGNGGGGNSHSDYVEISTNDKNPSTSEYIDLEIDTDDDYVGKVYLTAKYRSSTSNSWSTISNTSSDYFSNRSTAWNNGYVSLTSSNNGHKKINDAFKFAKKGYYRIYAKDVDGNTDYIDFNVGNPSSSDNEVELSTNKTNPSTSEWVNLTIDTDDDYVGNISFYKVQYRSSTSNSWTTISSRTDSTYFSNYSDEWEQGYYKMKSSDDGHKVISNFLKFAKKGYYRIYAKDVDGNTDYIDFNVGNPSSSDNEVELSTNKTNPSTSEWVNLTIDTDDDYVGNISFYKVQYRSSTSNSWTTISSRTDSTYFSNYSDEWEQGYYKMKSSDDGHKVISNFLKFAKKGYYRIYAKDVDGNTDYIDFNVGGLSSTDNEVELSANKTNPSTSEWIRLTINTDNDYVGNISFYKVQYRSSSSSSWSTIYRTDSTYFSNYSDEWKQGYYKMKSSDDGHKVISNFLKFAKKGYYRIYAKDVNGNYDYIDFNVGGSSSSSNDLELGTNDESPAASEYVDLTVETDSSYRGKVNFSAKYRSSTSNSWTDISRTNSNYFINRSTTWNNGYVTMTSSDHGEKTVENIFKFAKKGYYRIIAEDEDGNTTYLDFNVGYSSTSPLVGFTWKEFEMIERIYNVWPTLISKLKSEYPRLRNNTTWRNLSDDLYENMGDVVHKRSNREFQDYDDFDRGFRYWFNRTQDLMN